MYRKILVALDNSPADESLLPHITELARRLGSELLLLHVADGFVARSFDQLKLAESEEMKADRAYLEKSPPVCARKKYPFPPSWRWAIHLKKS
jgi:manganese transport protein